jgi:hypothetical protein
MKKALLIIAAVLMITTTANCQWVQRKYGVNDINMLSTEQLNGALRSAKSRVWTGAFISYFGTTSLFLGLSIKNPGHSTRGPGGEGRAFKDAFLTMGSVLELAGLPILLTNCIRKNNIKKALKKTEVNFGLSNYPTYNISNSTDISSVPSISVTIRF